MGLGAHWAISGVWLGLIAGLFVICVVDIVFVWRIDWEKERIRAQERAEKAEDQSKLMTESEGGEYTVVSTESPEEMQTLSSTTETP